MTKSDVPEKLALLNIQSEICDALLGATLPLHASDIFAVDDASQLEPRFSVYQNNVMYSLQQALADLYPTTKRLLGDEFFNGLANEYNRQFPPSNPAMVEFGQDFPEFLKTSEHTRQLTYLHDIGLLELSRHQAYHAEDLEVLSPEAFASLTPDILTEKRVIFHPSLKIIRSNFSIFRLWEMHEESQVDDSEQISIDQAQHVLIVRPEYEVMMYDIQLGVSEFFGVLERGLSLGEGLAHGMECDSTFNPTHAISFMISAGLLVALK